MKLRWAEAELDMIHLFADALSQRVLLDANAQLLMRHDMVWNGVTGRM